MSKYNAQINEESITLYPYRGVAIGSIIFFLFLIALISFTMTFMYNVIWYMIFSSIMIIGSVALIVYCCCLLSTSLKIDYNGITSTSKLKNNNFIISYDDVQKIELHTNKYYGWEDYIISYNQNKHKTAIRVTSIMYKYQSEIEHFFPPKKLSK